MPHHAAPFIRPKDDDDDEDDDSGRCGFELILVSVSLNLYRPTRISLFRKSWSNSRDETER